MVIVIVSVLPDWRARGPPFLYLGSDRLFRGLLPPREEGEVVGNVKLRKVDKARLASIVVRCRVTINSHDQ